VVLKKLSFLIKALGYIRRHFVPLEGHVTLLTYILESNAQWSNIKINIFLKSLILAVKKDVKNTQLNKMRKKSQFF
jgi:hypothetical protein